MKKFYILTLLAGTLLTGCELKDKAQELLDISRFSSNSKVYTTEKKQFAVICEKGDLREQLDNGWKVVKSTTEEVTCSWKTERSTPGCNLDRDKGCSITVPDKKGVKVNYELERKKKQDLEKIEVD